MDVIGGIGLGDWTYGWSRCGVGRSKISGRCWLEWQQWLVCGGDGKLTGRGWVERVRRVHTLYPGLTGTEFVTVEMRLGGDEAVVNRSVLKSCVNLCQMSLERVDLLADLLCLILGTWVSREAVAGWGSGRCTWILQCLAAKVVAEGIVVEVDYYLGVRTQVAKRLEQAQVLDLETI